MIEIKIFLLLCSSFSKVPVPVTYQEGMDMDPLIRPYRNLHFIRKCLTFKWEDGIRNMHQSIVHGFTFSSCFQCFCREGWRYEEYQEIKLTLWEIFVVLQFKTINKLKIISKSNKVRRIFSTAPFLSHLYQEFLEMLRRGPACDSTVGTDWVPGICIKLCTCKLLSQSLSDTEPHRISISISEIEG